MKVYVLLGVRDEVEYEDPGAEEPLSVWATEDAAKAAGKRLETTRDPLHQHVMLGYDGWDVREFEVWT